MEVKQHAMCYSFKNSRFPLRMRIRFLHIFHFQNNSMPTSSSITERTTPQTRPTAQKGKRRTVISRRGRVLPFLSALPTFSRSVCLMDIIFKVIRVLQEALT